MSDEPPWDRLDDPRVAGLAGLLLFGLGVAVLVLTDRPLELLLPAALVSTGLLLSRRVPESPVALVLVGFVVRSAGSTIRRARRGPPASAAPRWAPVPGTPAADVRDRPSVEPRFARPHLRGPRGRLREKRRIG